MPIKTNICSVVIPAVNETQFIEKIKLSKKTQITFLCNKLTARFTLTHFSVTPYS